MASGQAGLGPSYWGTRNRCPALPAPMLRAAVECKALRVQHPSTHWSQVFGVFLCKNVL